VGAADVEEPAALPPFCQRLKLGAENGAVTEAVPARGYLVKDFPRFLFDDLTPLSENSKLHILNHQMSLRGTPIAIGVAISTNPRDSSLCSE